MQEELDNYLKEIRKCCQKLIKKIPPESIPISMTSPWSNTNPEKNWSFVPGYTPKNSSQNTETRSPPTIPQSPNSLLNVKTTPSNKLPRGLTIKEKNEQARRERGIENQLPMVEKGLSKSPWRSMKKHLLRIRNKPSFDGIGNGDLAAVPDENNSKSQELKNAYSTMKRRIINSANTLKMKLLEVARTVDSNQVHNNMLEEEESMQSNLDDEEEGSVQNYMYNGGEERVPLHFNQPEMEGVLL